MKLCGREECIYDAVQKMIDKMKKEVAERQNIGYEGQIVVAKIYDITADILAEACRRNLKVNTENCEPSKQFKLEQLNMDTFILLNQLKDDGFISEEYKQTIFNSLTDMKPEIKEIVKELV